MIGSDPLFLAVQVALLGLGLVLLMALIRKAVFLLRLRWAWRRRLRRMLPAIEFLVGLSFLAWALIVILRDRSPFTMATLGLIVAVLIATAWFALRDYVSGVILQAENLYEENQRVAFSGTAGRVRNVGLRTLEIETEDGKRVKIPYRKMTGAALEISDEQAFSKAHTFRLAVPRSLSPTETIARVRTAALNAFWSSVKHEPHVQLRGENPEHFTVEVTVYALEEAYGSEIEHAVKRALALE